MDGERLRRSLLDHVDWGGLLADYEGGVSAWANKVRHHPEFAPLIAEIREEADQLMESPLPHLPWSKHRLYADEGSRLPYEELYFNRRRRLTACALMAIVEPGESKYSEHLLDVIWAICDEFTWCLPAHLPTAAESDLQYSVHRDEWMHDHSGIWVDLFASETAFALAEIASLLGSQLPEELQRRIQYEVYRRVLYPFIHKGPFGWEEARHNWSAVCAGSISAAAIYMMDDPDELADVLACTLHSLDCFLEGFETDGACMEGFYYWGYGFGFYVYAADLIRSRTGGRINLFERDKVRAIAMFQQKCFLSGNRVVNFADASAIGNVQLGLAHYLGRLYPDCEVPETRLRASFADDHCGRWAPAWRNLLWFSPDQNGHPWREASYWLEDAEWMISRQVRESGTYSFAAKGGHNGEPHNHNDVGHFILHADGESLLADMGWGEYNARYFGEERYSFICTSSQGHSVPIVGGRFQRPGEERKAKLLNVSQNPVCDVLELDMAVAYDVGQLQALVRRWEWHKEESPYLVLTDTYIFQDVGDGDGSGSGSGFGQTIDDTESQVMDRGMNPEDRTAGRSMDRTADHMEVVERLICAFQPEQTERNCYEVRGGKGCVKVRFDADVMVPEVQTLTMRNHHGEWMDYYALDFTMKADRSSMVARFVFEFDR